MPRVRVLRPHASSVGIGIFKVGDVYEESQLAAEQKVNAGFVEYVDGTPVKDKRSTEMYDRMSVRAESVGDTEERPTLDYRTGQWYYFSDGTKALGKTAAAERLGVSVEELENVDLDDG